MTWNATGVMSSCTYLCEALNEYSVDICGIAEHWLYEQNLHFLNAIDNKYCSHAVSDFSLLLPSNRKVGKGGVAILWKRALNNIITPLDINDDRIIGIQVQINPETIMFIFQVYIPCGNHGTEVFKRYIEKLENIIFNFSQRGLIIVMGDMNADVDTGTRRKAYFSDMLRRNNLYSINRTMLGNLCTNVNYNGNVASVIDHILAPIEKSDMFTWCSIPDDNALNVSSHRPVLCTVMVPVFNSAPRSSGNAYHINWSKVSQDHITMYQSYLETHNQCDIELNKNISSTSDIDSLYKFIVSVIKEANENCFPKTEFKHYLKPYWDDELKSVCKISKIKRRQWIVSGKPRGSGHLSYTEYKDAKRNLRKIHRRKVLKYITKLHEEIDKYAEIDSRLFWKCINRRKPKTRTSVGNEIVFNDITYREPKLINDNWADYYKKLYTPSQDADFNDSYKHVVHQDLVKINEYVSSVSFNESVTNISVDEVKLACDKAKRNKACGPDGCFYENFKLGGNLLHNICAKLFSAMLSYSHCPIDMKKGDIIVLHKGGNKSYSDPNNYRAITLSSVVLKLYESVILSRMKQSRYIINDLQGGFREGMGCLMTSFLFRECNNYAIENNSKLYTCFLDVRQAFDRVWHDALMVKLFNTNIDIPLFKAIMNLYQDMESRVKSNGYTSDWFPIQQGTRQGGVISPQLYIIFINDLMNNLVNSPYGFNAYDINCTCPTSADDMVLLSLSKSSLQELMNICYEYGITFRYNYNAKKSAVIVTNDKSPVKTSSNSDWYLGNDIVNETVSYTHLGVLFNRNEDFSTLVRECSSKLRKTLFSIINYGIYENGINPITAKRLYETIVLPKALYGCEMWSYLSKDNISALEIAHRFCIKLIQSVPKFSRSDIVLTSLGMLPIEAEIDKRKLIFLGQLCRIEGDAIVKRLFINRLCDYFNNSSRSRGFIPDIHRICGKYDLTEILNIFYRSGVFPCKSSWKRIVCRNVELKQLALLQSRVLSDNRLQEYSIIQSFDEIRPCHFWYLCKSDRNCSRLAYAAMKFTHLLFVKPYVTRCKRCNNLTDELAMHLALYCETTLTYRHRLWENIYNVLCNEVFETLILHSPRKQLLHLLSGLRHIINSDVEKEYLRIIGLFCLNILNCSNTE